MKNVTITLDESLVKWAKVTAARHQKSLSKFIAGLLANLKETIGDQNETVSEFRAYQPRNISDQGKRAFSREDIYERRGRFS
jgi:hypothetical protein